MAAAIHNSGGKVQQKQIGYLPSLALHCLALPCLALLYTTYRQKEKKRNLGFHVSISPPPPPPRGPPPPPAPLKRVPKFKNPLGTSKVGGALAPTLVPW